MELTYSQQGDYQLPNLILPQEEISLGKYGRLRRNYLEQHRRVLYTNLLTKGALNQHLAEIEETARTQVEQTVAAMAIAQGVTEELKASDQMRWVGLMNNFRQAAEEAVLTNLIYS